MMNSKMNLVFGLIFFCLTIAAIVCKNVDVKTSSGVVRGQTVSALGQSIDQFLGIPFAEPPIGERRFGKPKRIEKPLPGVIDATKFKHSCWQGNRRHMNITMNEDCLFLNIWTPSQNKSSLKPVMFWIYGGGLMSGSAMTSGSDGSVLASHDVVLVTTNYRLGTLGFLYGNDSTAPGNVGFYDQLMALKWVNENIHLFGGDKSKITIFGESAGSWSVSAQVISPESKGLFRRAILESGSVLYSKTDRTHSPGKGLKLAKDAAKQFNCTDKNWLQCMRKVDAKALGDLVGWMAIQETEFLPETTTNAFAHGHINKDLDMIAGVTKTEGSLATHVNLVNPTEKDFRNFVSTQSHWLNGIDVDNVTKYYLKNVNTSNSEAIKFKIWDFYGDIYIKCPTYLFAKTYAKQSSDKTNVYFYEWTHTKGTAEDEKKSGVPHGSDVVFVFGLQLLDPKHNTKENLEFSKNIVKYWTDFAKYGTTHWPNMIDKSGKTNRTTTNILNPKEQVVFDHFEQCEQFWKSYFI